MNKFDFFKTIFCATVLMFNNTSSAQTTYIGSMGFDEWHEEISQDSTINLCSTEMFFPNGGDFRTTPLQLNGFRLEQISGSTNGYNVIRNNRAEMCVRPTKEVKLTFTTPQVVGFLSRFISPFNTGGLIIYYYDYNMELIDSFNFAGWPLSGWMGFMNPNNVPISHIIFTGHEIFYLDNFMIACNSNISWRCIQNGHLTWRNTPTGEYSAEETMISLGCILDNNQVVFKAGENVVLDNGFSCELGGQIKIEIEGCPN